MRKNSMLLYLSMYSASILFYIFVQRRESYKKVQLNNGRKASDLSKKNHFDILLLLEYIGALMIPCLLAAMRDASVGIDANTYIMHNFRYVQNSDASIIQCVGRITKLNELLFAILIFFCAKVGSISLLFFIIQLLIILPLVVALRRMKTSYFYGMLIFYLLFYNVTLGLMRQSIAASFLTLAYTYIIDNKIWRAIFLSGMAFLFHKSALFVLVLFVIYRLLKNSKYKKVVYGITILLMILVLFQGKEFGEEIQRIVGRIIPSYVNALRFHFTGSINLNMVSWSNILTHSVLIIITFLILTIAKKYNDVDDDLQFMCIVGIFLRLLSMRILIAVRMAEYFDLFLVLFVPRITKGISNNLSSRFVLLLTILGICIPFWYFFYIYKNNMNTAYYYYKGWR